jgi:hypothetical protein
MIKIGIILGSTRPNRNGEQVANSGGRGRGIGLLPEMVPPPHVRDIGDVGIRHGAGVPGLHGHPGWSGSGVEVTSGGGP